MDDSNPPDLLDALPSKIATIRREIREEYSARHRRPWIVAVSGGKDSTLLLQLVFEAMFELAPSLRKRHVYVVCNDTLVENQAVATHVAKFMEQVADAADAFGLPMTVKITKPDPSETFWVLLIGRGYPAPNRLFRWCTDRLKIQPTTRFITECVSEHGEVILLLGVRRSESAARAASIAKHDAHGRLNPHNDLPNCLVYRPIADITNDELWPALLQSRPPWGGTHRNLITLYRNANGECPVVMSPDDAPSCGSTSPRMGCWTCTVVEKDKSAAAMVANGLDHLEPMCDFRDWLRTFSADPVNRMPERRIGKHGIGDGLGPLTIDARKAVLAKLEEVEKEMGCEILTQEERERVAFEWEQDAADWTLRHAKRTLRLFDV